MENKAGRTLLTEAVYHGRFWYAQNNDHAKSSCAGIYSFGWAFLAEPIDQPTPNDDEVPPFFKIEVI